MSTRKFNKQKLEFVDEFRKLRALEKLPKMVNIFQDQSKRQNKSFMRVKDQPLINYCNSEQQQQIMLQNLYVEERVKNRLNQQTQQYKISDQKVSTNIKMYKDWSDSNKNLQNKTTSFKFYYRNASPPNQLTYKQKQQQKNKSDHPNKYSHDDKNTINNQDKFAIDHPKNFIHQQFKYDFFQINHKRNQLESQKIKSSEQEKQQQQIFNQTFSKFQQYKSLSDIKKINQLKMLQQDFKYNFKQNYKNKIHTDKYFINKFIYKSIVKLMKSNLKDIQFFRDIGLPSRNLQKYSETVGDKKNIKMLIIEQQTRQQEHYLHLLCENQLNINKYAINFYDILNISTGRITPSNADLCVRSEKVSKVQIEKLAKKLQKYKKQQIEKGKEKAVLGVQTQISLGQQFVLQDDQHPNTIPTQDRNVFNQLVQQIIQLRQTNIMLKNKKNQTNLVIKQNQLNKQKYTRMQILLTKIYQQIMKQPDKYPFNTIQQHLDQIQHLLRPQYANGKLLWFIIECYQQILANCPDSDNLRTVLKKKQIAQPILTFYKQQKLIKQQKIKTIHLFTQTDHKKYQKPQRDLPKNKTPNKINNAKINKNKSITNKKMQSTKI